MITHTPQPLALKFRRPCSSKFLCLCIFSTPYRAIQALLNGASEMEKTNMYRFQEVMKTMGATAAGSTGGLGQFQQSKPQYIPGT